MQFDGLFQTFWKYHKDCCFVLLNGSVHSVQRGYGSFSSKIWISCLALLQLRKNNASRRRRLGTIAFSTASTAQHSSVILKMAEKLPELSLKGLNTVSCRTRCDAGAPSLAASELMVLYCGELCYVLVLVLWAVFRRVLCAMRSCRRVQMCYEELWELFRPSRHPGRGRWARLPRPKPSSSSLSPVTACNKSDPLNHCPKKVERWKMP